MTQNALCRDSEERKEGKRKKFAEGKSNEVAFTIFHTSFFFFSPLLMGRSLLKGKAEKIFIEGRKINLNYKFAIHQILPIFHLFSSTNPPNNNNTTQRGK